MRRLLFLQFAAAALASVGTGVDVSSDRLRHRLCSSPRTGRPSAASFPFGGLAMIGDVRPWRRGAFKLCR